MTKHTQTTHIPDKTEIGVRQVPETQITIAACYHHMGRRQRQHKKGTGETGAPRNIKERWAVNYIRHTLTDYDTTLPTLPDQYHKQYKLNVLDAIADTYPQFRRECERQKRDVQREMRIDKLNKLNDWCEQCKQPTDMMAADYAYNSGYNQALETVQQRIRELIAQEEI